MPARLRCRLIGHKWALQPGITQLMPQPGHEHDVLYECRRCGVGEWRHAAPGRLKGPEPPKTPGQLMVPEELTVPEQLKAA